MTSISSDFAANLIGQGSNEKVKIEVLEKETDDIVLRKDRELTIERETIKDINPDQLQVKNHVVALINFANINLQTKSDSPAFRVLGFFPNQEAAAKHAKRNFPDVAEGANIRCIETHKPYLLCEHEHNLQDQEYCAHKIDKIAKAYNKKHRDSQKDFDDTVKNQRAGKVSSRVKQILKDRQKERKRQETEPQRPSSVEAVPSLDTTITASQIIMKQNVAVIIYMQDLDNPHSNDIVLAVLGGFEDVEKAKEYVVDIAHHHYAKLHIDIVDMYEWHKPLKINPHQIDEVYGIKTLDKIWRHKKEESKKAEAVLAKQLASDGDQEIKFTEGKERVDHDTGEVLVAADPIKLPDTEPIHVQPKNKSE